MRQGDLILSAGRVRSQEKKDRKKNHDEKSSPPKKHHENHISPATATTSRQRATRRVPRVSPYTPASIDPGFVGIGLVQLSQSVKTTNDKHILPLYHKLGYLNAIDCLGATVLVMVACLLYTSPSPRDGLLSRMPSSA